MTRKFFDDVKSFESNNYLDERLDRLVTVGLMKLEDAKMERTFDNVVVVLHKLFPEKFSLISFPEYPDSIRVDNTLRLDCQHSKFLTGNRVKGYTLTSLGRISAEDTIEKIKNKKSRSIKSSPRLPASRRNRATRTIDSLRTSEGYRKFSSKQYNEINKFDVCEVLHGTLDTKIDMLKQNSDTLRKYAEDLNQLSQYKGQMDKVFEFLDFIETKCFYYDKIKKTWEWVLND